MDQLRASLAVFKYVKIANYMIKISAIYNNLIISQISDSYQRVVYKLFFRDILNFSDFYVK